MKWHTKNRLLAFLLVFVFAFGLAACNDNTAEEATTPAGAVTTTAEGAADAATDTVGDAVDATTDTVGDAADATTDTVSDSLDGATDTVGDAADAATDATVDAAQETAETTDEAVESVNEATTDTIGDAADVTEETADEAAAITTEPIGDAADATADTATDAAAAVGAELDGIRSQVVSDMEGLDLTNEDETNVLTVQNTLTTARENLATAYAGADEAAQAEWAELQPQFEEAEATLQDNAAEGLQQVQALLERLQQTVSQ